MLKIIPLLVLMLVGAISLPMEPTTVASQDGEVVGFYRNTTEGFSVRLPEGWVGHENEDNYPLLSIQTRGGTHPAFADVWVYPRTDDTSAESWYNSQIIDSPPERSDRSVRYSLPSADSAFQSVDSWGLDDGTAITVLTTVVVRRSQVFQIHVGTS